MMLERHIYYNGLSENFMPRHAAPAVSSLSLEVLRGGEEEKIKFLFSPPARGKITLIQPVCRRAYALIRAYMSMPPDAHVSNSALYSNTEILVGIYHSSRVLFIFCLMQRHAAAPDDFDFSLVFQSFRLPT